MPQYNSWLVSQSFYNIRIGGTQGKIPHAHYSRVNQPEENQPEERRKLNRKVQELLVIAVCLLLFRYSVTFGNDSIKLGG